MIGRAHGVTNALGFTRAPTFTGSFIQSDIACLQVQQLTQIATPLLNTFSQGVLQNPAARQALQDLTVTPNLEQLIQGLQNLTAITNPPVFSLLVRLLLSEKSCPTFCLK